MDHRRLRGSNGWTTSTALFLLGASGCGNGDLGEPLDQMEEAAKGTSSSSSTGGGAGGTCAPWSNPATWGGTLPGATTQVTIASGQCVVLDTSPTVAGVVVQSGATLRYQPAATRTLQSSKNVLVEGTLEMKPASASAVHTLRFVNVVESQFVGGGMDPLATDVGLWVMGSGKLDILGTAKDAWNRTGQSATWAASDELVLTPTATANFTGFTPFTAGSSVPTVNGTAAEVLDLTRNVRIEGTPTGRTHVFIRSTSVQSIRFAAIRYVGPRQGNTFVLGRYGVHFHHCMEGSRGSVVEGVVVRDAGSHAFVPHMSDGITLLKTIAYATTEEAYWWDDADPSDDTVIDSCVAAKVVPGSATTSNRNSGFSLRNGENNMVKNSVGVGVLGGKNSAGFLWPEGGGGAIWGFENNVAHNNENDGTFIWLNTGVHFLGPNFVAYRNGKAGIEHGAYFTGIEYENMSLYQNGQMGIMLHAVSRAPDSQGHVQTFDRIVSQGGQYGVSIRLHHNTPGLTTPTPIVDCTFKGYSTAAVHVDEAGGDFGRYDFIRTKVGATLHDLEPADFQIVSMVSGSRIRVQRQNNQSAYQIDPGGTVTPIAPFAP